ncbi:MAG: hypothetical protein M1812_004755 [Candelaria pacifica]|nr:MAG: hypothetical protein M1812_004755 [Candelaria pacifica]
MAKREMKREIRLLRLMIDKAQPSVAAERSEVNGQVGSSSASINTTLTATIDAAKKFGQKASGMVEEVIEKLENAIGEGSVGPYESPSTCAQSDLDPLAGCVKAGVDLKGGDDVGQSEGEQKGKN